MKDPRCSFSRWNGHPSLCFSLDSSKLLLWHSSNAAVTFTLVGVALTFSVSRFKLFSAFLRVESIDRTWHPFSIASDPDSNKVEFYIEVFGEGSWTDRLWVKLNNQDKGQKMYIDLLGWVWVVNARRNLQLPICILLTLLRFSSNHRPYGTALVKNSSYTNIVAIGTGTGESDTVTNTWSLLF